MIAGHFGFAALVKSRERQAPLWALMLATVWLDIVFVPLFVAGVETVALVGRPGGYGAGIIHADYTHSLIGAIALSVVFGLAFGWRWGSRTAIVLGLVSFSHWVLDLLVHRADMPLFPGHDLNQFRFGIGLWRYPWTAASTELLLVVMGAWLYWLAARAISLEDDKARQRARLVSLLILIGGIVVLGLDVSGIGG
ncbi:MAG TPA: hypothetical protein VNZ53_37095 [Steroidobacteraceae bacterium]|nr:hypothetical protein [Steroidobacteraceae bacterium]